MTARRSSTIDRTGHCYDGFHSNCPGGLRAPQDRYWRCECECHAGQERTAPAVALDAKPLKRSEEVRDWAAELVVKGVLELNAPDDDKARMTLQNRMRTVGKHAGVPYTVSCKNGKIAVRVKEAS